MDANQIKVSKKAFSFSQDKALVILATVVMLALSVCAAKSAQAGDWTTEQKVTEGIYQAMHFADTLQTIDIAKNPQRFQETNLMIGAHPTTRVVDEYMTAEAIAHFAVSEALIKLDAPNWVVRTWETVTIGREVSNLRGNYKIGVRFSF